MIITIDVQSMPDMRTMHVPQVMMTIEHPNIVAYKASTNAICAIGDTADTMRQAMPDYWEKHKGDIRFAHPFDVRTFAPDFAIAVLNYHTYSAHQRIREGLQSLWKWIDQFEYDLGIRDYETLLIEARTRFARQLDRDLLVRHRHLRVHNL